MVADVHVTGAAELRALAADLKAADLVPEFRKELRVVAAPIVADVRAQQAAIPSHGRKHTGLRAALMRATSASVNVSARDVRMRIQTNPARMPPNQRAMPAAMEGGSFTHPVFGHKDRTVTQAGHPYLHDTVIKHIPQARAAVTRAAEAMARKITRRG